MGVNPTYGSPPAERRRVAICLMASSVRYCLCRSHAAFRDAGTGSPMIVKLLRITIYESRWAWRIEDIPDPIWDAIETAIRRLDRFRYPFVWLYRDKDSVADAVPDFAVTGGEGVFAFECIAGGMAYRYVDPDHSDNEIAVWKSDEGAVFAERFCCYSLETVLQATRYFCEHGAPDLRLIWQQFQP